MSHSPTQYKKDFLTSGLAIEIRQELEAMVADATYHTNNSYSPSDDGDGVVTFVDKHYTYLSTHPKSKPGEYMANLRLMTRVSNIQR